MCDVGYLCANFGLPRPLCSRLRPYVRDRQTSDVRQKHRLMFPPIRGGGKIIITKLTQSRTRDTSVGVRVDPGLLAIRPQPKTRQ